MVDLLSLFSRSKNNIAIFNSTVITLYQQGPRFSFFAIQCSARYPRYFLVANNSFAIRHQCYHSSNKGNVIGLPFTRVLRYLLTWRYKSINTP